MMFTAVALSAILGLTMATPVPIEARGVTTWQKFTPPAGMVKGTSPAVHPTRDASASYLMARDDPIWAQSINAYRRYASIPTVHPDQDMINGATQSMEEAQGQMVHSLYDGALAQVIAPAPNGDDYTTFNDMLIGGWLCEKPDAYGLDGRCSYPPYNSWYHDGDTGHYDIITNGNYQRAGCAYGYGLWFFNFA